MRRVNVFKGEWVKFQQKQKDRQRESKNLADLEGERDSSQLAVVRAGRPVIYPRVLH